MVKHSTPSVDLVSFGAPKNRFRLTITRHDRINLNRTVLSTHWLSYTPCQDDHILNTHNPEGDSINKKRCRTSSSTQGTQELDHWEYVEEGGGSRRRGFIEVVRSACRVMAHDPAYLTGRSSGTMKLRSLK